MILTPKVRHFWKCISHKADLFLSFLFESSNNSAATLRIGKIAERNIGKFGIERNKSVTAELLEISLAVQNEDSKLADLNAVTVLDKQNVAIVIFGLHTVSAYTQSIIRTLGFDGVGNIDLVHGITVKINASTCGNGHFKERNNASAIFGCALCGRL